MHHVPSNIFIYKNGYEHEAIQNPISKNNIGAPLAPQKHEEERYTAHARDHAPTLQISGRGRGRGRGWDRGRGSTRRMEATVEGECQAQGFICAVGEQRNPPLCETLELNGVPVCMEVDTGAAVSRRSSSSFRRRLWRSLPYDSPCTPPSRSLWLGP